MLLLHAYNMLMKGIAINDTETSPLAILWAYK